jgi:predicted nucleic acid-binding Zn ribbon protein
MPEINFCPTCGAAVERRDASFCSSCGARLRQEEISESHQRVRHRGLLMAALAAILVAGLAVGIYLVVRSHATHRIDASVSSCSREGPVGNGSAFETVAANGGVRNRGSAMVPHVEITVSYYAKGTEDFGLFTDKVQEFNLRPGESRDWTSSDVVVPAGFGQMLQCRATVVART